MKKIFYALFAAALMMSCSETNVEEGVTPPQSQGNAIEFYAVGDESRTTYFEGDGLRVHWEAGDQIPIIARGWYDNNGVKTETRNRGKYTAESSGASTKFVHDGSDDLSWDFELKNTSLKITEQPVDFVALYCNPYSAATTIYDGIKVYSDYLQKQAKANDYTHVADYMVMASNMVHREAGDQTPVAFQFTNCTSIVELTLKGDASKSVTAIEMSSNAADLGFKEAYLCVEDWPSTDVVEEPYALYAKSSKNVAGDLSDKVTLSLTEAAPLSAEGTKFYLVVMPGSHNAGDITLTVHCVDGTYSTVEMGAITFEKNKVYSPSVILSNFVKKEAADIKHIFSDSYETPITFAEGAYVITGRDTYPLVQVPQYAQSYQIAKIGPSLYPSINKIEALTDGYVYVLVGSSGTATVTNAEKTRDFFFQNGWVNVSDIPAEQLTAKPESPTALYYWNEDPAKLNGWCICTLYERYMRKGETFDLYTYAPELVKNFQAIRPIAKTITNEVDNAKILTFDFSKQPTDWTKYTSFNNVRKDPIQGNIDYVISDTEKYTLNFSYTPIDTSAANPDNTGGGSGYHQDNYLLMYIRFSTAESIGLPAIEGYKLVNVAGKSTNANVTPTIGISSVAAPDAPNYVSDTFTFTGSVINEWSLDVANAADNTSYYFYATDKISKNHDPRITSLVLTYEPVE